MLFEVHTGASPGRPRLLLFLSAGLLAGALGLAWIQVRAARGLGPEQQIGDTPLWVRPPKGWRADSGDPQRFILPTGQRGSRAVLERSMRFDVVRQSSFEPVELLLRNPNLLPPGQIVHMEPARLGPYSAAQVRSLQPLQVGRARLARETLTRLTCLPRGQVLRAVYEPLSELGPADVDIFDEVCATLRVADPSLDGLPVDYLNRAGLTLPLDAAWRTVGPDFAEVPAVYIGGVVDEVPAWSIAVFRTWLAAGRTPRDLLVDFAAERWLSWDVADWIQEESRADGATVTSIHPPRAGQRHPSPASAWVARQSAGQAVIMFVYAGPQEVAKADEVAAGIAAAIQIAPLDAIPPVAEAEAAGATLAGDLRKAGPASRWGRESVETTYRCVARDDTIVVQRGARERDPTQGYEGSLWRRIGRARENREVWTVDGRAGAYARRVDFFSDQSTVQVVERRSRADDEVTRRILIDDRERQQWSFTPGPGFVPPPTESIILGWVARAEPGVAIVEVSSLLGPGTHTELVRHLPADGAYPRVLVQQDYWPEGSIEAFDDARAETQYELSPTAEYRRVK